MHDTTDTNSTMSYNTAVEELQATEYPMLQGKSYLDHGGTTIYARSLIKAYAEDLASNLYGNPHSMSSPAKLSGQVVDDTRIKTLKFFGADPEHFDLIFVANATAAVKLLMDCIRDLSLDRDDGGFWYGYHVDCHNSVIGVREAAGESHCFTTDTEVDQWISGTLPLKATKKIGLFAYPGQSNMTGRRLPLGWTGQLRNSWCESHQYTYSLLDAAALATTYPLNGVFQNPHKAPDFTAVSFYKIFGFPDLGGLIVRKASSNILRCRKYFGGGTVTAVTVIGDINWHESREVLHANVEDGTLPFHSIIALDTAIKTHVQIYGPNPMMTISRHTSFLGKYLYDAVSTIQHYNGRPILELYTDSRSTYGDSTTQGATLSFNVVQADGTYIAYTSTIEKLADEYNIFVRAGQLCNPGGIATNLRLGVPEIQALWDYGHRCGMAHITGTEIHKGKATGVVRVSLGAMTTIGNIDTLVTFLKENFVTAAPSPKFETRLIEGPKAIRKARTQVFASDYSNKEESISEIIPLSPNGFYKPLNGYHVPRNGQLKNPNGYRQEGDARSVKYIERQQGMNRRVPSKGRLYSLFMRS